MSRPDAHINRLSDEESREVVTGKSRYVVRFSARDHPCSSEWTD